MASRSMLHVTNFKHVVWSSDKIEIQEFDMQSIFSSTNVNRKLSRSTLFSVLKKLLHES